MALVKRAHPEKDSKTKPEIRAGEQVSETERIHRARTMRDLVVNTNSREQIIRVMQERHPGISAQTVDRLRNQVQKAVVAESAEAAMVYRAKQIARLHGHIAQARAQKKWSAVAQFERLLAEVTGTLKPLKIQPVASGVKDAFNEVLSLLSPEQLEALSAGEEIPLGHLGPETADFETTAEIEIDEC